MSRYKRFALLYTYSDTYLSADSLYIETGMFTAGFLCAVMFQKSRQTEFRKLWFVMGIAFLPSFLLTLLSAPELTGLHFCGTVKFRSADFPTSNSFYFHWRLWYCQDVVDLLTAKEWRPVVVPSWRRTLFADAGAVYLCFGSDDVNFPRTINKRLDLYMVTIKGELDSLHTVELTDW